MNHLSNICQHMMQTRARSVKNSLKMHKFRFILSNYGVEAFIGYFSFHSSLNIY